MPECRTFDSVCVRLTSATGPIVILNVYRPGSEKRPPPLFYDELSTVLETLVVYACPVVIGGDFNVHAQDTDDPDARRLADLLQHVSGPTHRYGNTLDLVKLHPHRVSSIACRYAVRSFACHLSSPSCCRTCVGV